ncbi:MAG: hypothetical protein EBR86_04165 [Planctomycetia bacterium]|nr:hypothetical protein [Planctomycetia bacterium]
MMIARVSSTVASTTTAAHCTHTGCGSTMRRSCAGIRCRQSIQCTSRLRRRRLTVAWLTTAGRKPARYSTTTATPTLATNARRGSTTAGKAKSAARPTHDTITSPPNTAISPPGSVIPPATTPNSSAPSPTAVVQMTDARKVPSTRARRPPGRVATWTQVPRSNSSATAGHIVTKSPSMHTASGTRA